MGTRTTSGSCPVAGLVLAELNIQFLVPGILLLMSSNLGASNLSAQARK
jgi:hypothetical protein